MSRRTLIARHLELSHDMKVVLLKDVSELKIKDALLREIHHRVKNNLATVASLLRMQSRRNPELKQSFDEAITRINSIGMVHETLAYADKIEQVDFGELAGTIIKEVLSSFGAKDIKVNYHCPEKIYCAAEKATNMALVLNELLSNSLEHGGKNLSEINISLYPDHDRPGKMPNTHDIILRVQDDGCGYPEGFDYSSKPGLGWEIITAVAQESLGCDIVVENIMDGKKVIGAKTCLRIPGIDLQ